jgi:DNA-binding phage protein
MRFRSVFWDDLARDLEDPEFLREYVAESVRINTIDRLVNTLDDARRAAGLSKAALARAIRSEPAVVRRLLSGKHANPTVGTVSEIAAALGLRMVLEPMPAEEVEHVTRPLTEGHASDNRTLATHLDQLRTSQRHQPEPA